MLQPTAAQRVFVERHLSAHETSLTALIRDPETFELVSVTMQTRGRALVETPDGFVLRVFLSGKKLDFEGWFELDSRDVWRLWRQDAGNATSRSYRATTLAMFPASGLDYMSHMFRVSGPCPNRFKEIGHWGYDQDAESSLRVARHLPECAACRAVIRRLADHPDAFTRPLAVLASVMAQPQL